MITESCTTDWERATNHVVLSTPGGTHFFQSDGRFQTAQNGGYVVRAGMNAGAGANCFNINHGAGQQLWIDPALTWERFIHAINAALKKIIHPDAEHMGCGEEIEPD